MHSTWNFSHNCLTDWWLNIDWLLTECWLLGDWLLFTGCWLIGDLFLTDWWLNVDWLLTDIWLIGIKKKTDANVFDWLQQSLTNDIRHYLDNRQSIAQSINDVQHIADSYISKIVTTRKTNYVAINPFNINLTNKQIIIVKVTFFINFVKIFSVFSCF